MARKQRDYEYERPPTVSWRAVLELAKKGKLRSVEDAPEFVDFSEIHHYFSEMKHKGRKSGKENKWIITDTELVWIREGEYATIPFAKQETTPGGQGIAHNHPLQTTWESEKSRDSKIKTEYADYLSINDFIAYTFIKNDQDKPFPFTAVIHGNHVFIAFRTEKTPVHDLKKMNIIQAAFIAMRIKLFSDSIKFTSLIENILDFADKKLGFYNEKFEELTAKNARRLNKAVANQWGIALYEIPNYERPFDNDNMGRLINKE